MRFTVALMFVAAICMIVVSWPTSFFLFTAAVAVVATWIAIQRVNSTDNSADNTARPLPAMSPSLPPEPQVQQLRAGDRVRLHGLTPQRLESHYLRGGRFLIANGMIGTVDTIRYSAGGNQDRPVYVHLDSYGELKMYTPFQHEELQPLSADEEERLHSRRFKVGDRVRVARTIIDEFGDTVPGSYGIDLRGHAGVVDRVASGTFQVRMDDEPSSEVWFSFANDDLEAEIRNNTVVASE